MLFCAQAFDNLIDDGIGLAVEAEGIGGGGWLTALDLALRFFEMGLEGWPGFVVLWSAVPLSDVAREDGGAGDDDQPMLISWVFVSAASAASAMFA